MREADARVFRPFAHEHCGDHESGDDEEDVDTDEATWHRQMSMEGDDEQDGDGTQSLDIGAATGRRHG